MFSEYFEARDWTDRNKVRLYDLRFSLKLQKSLRVKDRVKIERLERLVEEQEAHLAMLAKEHISS